jgi:hypothetical protein
MEYFVMNLWALQLGGIPYRDDIWNVGKCLALWHAFKNLAIFIFHDEFLRTQKLFLNFSMSFITFLIQRFFKYLKNLRNSVNLIIQGKLIPKWHKLCIILPQWVYVTNWFTFLPRVYEVLHCEQVYMWFPCHIKATRRFGRLNISFF